MAVIVSCIIWAAAISVPLPAGTAGVDATRNAAPTIWRDPGDISSLNLYYGPGGREHEPTGDFTFVSEDKKGTSPKFDILDQQGTRWRAKLGEEAQPELPSPACYGPPAIMPTKTTTCPNCAWRECRN